MKKFTLITLTLLSAWGLLAQPNIEWKKSLGGTNNDFARSIQQTSDNGYIIAGSSKSTNGDVSGNHGEQDYWIVKLNTDGDIEWEKSLGGSDNDWATAIQQTSDKGYIVAGYTFSLDGEVSGKHGDNNTYSDYWIVKLNTDGDIEWEKCLGGSDHDQAFSVQQTSDGNYIVAGWTNSNDGDVVGNHAAIDYWIVKLNTSGDIEWKKCFGGEYSEKAYSIQQTTDKGYIIAGSTRSTTGDISENNHESFVNWIVKLNTDGDIEWEKCLGGSNDENAYSIQQTTDGGYIVAGTTESNDGDVSENNGNTDYWIVKLNTSGAIEWEKSLGGDSYEEVYSIQQTEDGNYIIAGSSKSTNDDVSGNHGNFDYWIVKLNTSGDLLWQKCLGGSDKENAYSIQQTTDKGYIVVGNADSWDDDVSGNNGMADYWVVKLSEDDASIKTINTVSEDLSIYPNPMNNYTEIEIPYNRDTKEPITVKIIDMSGKTVKQFNNVTQKKLRIQRENLESGIYQIIVSIDELIYTGKLTIK